MIFTVAETCLWLSLTLLVALEVVQYRMAKRATAQIWAVVFPEWATDVDVEMTEEDLGDATPFNEAMRIKKKWDQASERVRTWQTYAWAPLMLSVMWVWFLP